MLATALPERPQSAAQAVRRLLGASRRQACASASLVVAAGALSVACHAHAWLALFGAMLLPMLLAALGLLAASHWRRPGWSTLWSMLALLLMSGGALAQWLYQLWLASSHTPGLNRLQIGVSAIGFGALVLAIPLSQAQSQARTLHMAQLRQAALHAELQALQAQVEPHFLYNTLANARYLARHDPDQAVHMLVLSRC